MRGRNAVYLRPSPRSASASASRSTSVPTRPLVLASARLPEARAIPDFSFVDQAGHPFGRANLTRPLELDIYRFHELSRRVPDYARADVAAAPAALIAATCSSCS
jgi:hypothetical protein